MPRLEEYAAVAGPRAIDEVQMLAERLRGKSVLHVNSTAVGGGVAEILNCMVPLLNELDIRTKWEVIKGGEAFYAVTKKFHNALHGHARELAPKDYQEYEETLDRNLSEMTLDSDIVFIHDPQPAALVKKRRELRNRWLWRCHIDLSAPDPGVWGFLKPYIEQFDASVVSSPHFAQKLLIPQTVIAPSIDPLSDKNRELEPSEIRAIMDRLAIPLDKPLITQVSRFDRLKDPLGVIRSFQAAKPYCDARLLLVGGSATDDPEGSVVLEEVKEAASGDPDVIILALPPTSHVEINAIQRASTVILQKSLKEGFGLTVSEALWKGKPVIAGAVGGIPQQIVHLRTGILVHSVEGATYWMKQLLQDPSFAGQLGRDGREHVRRNFLLTRHLRDYMLLFLFALAGVRDSELIRL